MLYVLLLLILLISVLFFLFMKNYAPVDLSKPTDLSKVFPISSIENDVIINGNGDLTVGFDLLMPDIFSLSESQSDSIHDSFVSILKILPLGTIVHKQDLFFLKEHDSRTPDASRLKQTNETLFFGRPTVKQLSRIFLTFPKNTAFLNKRGNSLLFSPNYLFQDNISVNFNAFEKDVDNFYNALKSIPGFTPIRLREKELVNSIYGYINGTWGNPNTSTDDFSINPISVDENGNFKVGTNFLRVISLVEEGQKIMNLAVPKIAPSSTYNNGVHFSNTIKSKTSFIFPLAAGLPVDHVLNTRIQVLDNDFVFSLLNKEDKAMTFLGNFYKPAKVKSGYINQFINSVTQYGYQCCVTDVNVVLRSDSIAELDKYSGICQNAFVQMNGSRAYVENFDTANLIFSNIPGAPNLSYRGFYNTTTQACCYLNKETMVAGDAFGITLTDRFGTPVVIDMFDNKHTVNRNKLVFGPSGSGKSYTMNSYLSQSYDMGNHVIILDIGYSYKRNCLLHNGVHFDASNKKSLSFNLFFCDKDSSGNYVYLPGDEDEDFGKLDYISTVILFILKGSAEVSPVERAIYKKSIGAFYDYCNDHKMTASLTQYLAFCPTFFSTLSEDHKKHFNLSDLNVLLEPFVSGSNKHLLNSESNIDITNERFIVFDIEAIRKDPVVFPLVCLLIMELVIQKTSRLKGIRKTFAIDEGLDFLQIPIMADFIAYLYRTFRKKMGEVIFAAQNALYLDQAPSIIKDSILYNSAYNIMLDHSQHRSNYKDIQKILSFTDHQIEMLDSLEKGPGFRENFFKIGNYNAIFRMQVSEFADAAYTSVEKDTLKIETLALKYGSLETAILQYIEDKKKLQNAS